MRQQRRATINQAAELANGLLDRNVGIDAVEVANVDMIEAEALQAGLDRLPRIDLAPVVTLPSADARLW